MDDLTRRAVEEIVRDMHEQQEAEKELSKAPLERKKNPLGPNKRFLGRTLSDMKSHNKRADERTHRNCVRKLAELDRRWEKRKNKKRTKSKTSSSSALTISSPSSRQASTVRKHKKKHVKKLKKKKNSSTSSESVTSSSADEKDRNRKDKKKRKIKRTKARHSSSEDEKPSSLTGNGYTHTTVPEHYMNPYINGVALAAAAYNHMQQMLQLQAFMASTAQNEVITKSSDSGHYENGILTVDVSSGEETHRKRTRKKKSHAFDSESGLSMTSELNLSCSSSNRSCHSGEDSKNPPPSPHVVATISLESDEDLDKSNNNNITILSSSSSSSSGSNSSDEQEKLPNKDCNQKPALAATTNECNGDSSTQACEPTKEYKKTDQDMNTSIVILTSTSESESETVASQEQPKETVDANNARNVAIDLTES